MHFSHVHITLLKQQATENYNEKKNSKHSFLVHLNFVHTLPSSPFVFDNKFRKNWKNKKKKKTVFH